VASVRRRELLAGVAGATGLVAGCSGLTGESGSSGGTPDPVSIETLDAPGSEARSVSVPATDRVTFVEFFATTCDICAAQMSVIGDAHERVGDEVQFLSVTSEPVGLSVTRDEVRSWWTNHDGAWTVGLDEGTTLARRYDATSVPTAAVITPDGSLAWSHSGRTGADSIVGAIEDAQES
jgi:thiol-disulfide isomerase/thioredoxin